MSLTGRGTWGSPADPAGARALLRRAAELGVRLFDTADSYGPETAENLVREALHPYDGLLVATKGGFRRHGPHAWSADCRPEALRRACEGSLRRLGLERIDLYQLHVADRSVPIEESGGALAELQAEGKVRALGVCNVDADGLERARAAADLVSVQSRLSLAERGSEDVLAACEAAGLAFIAWAPLAKGSLAGGAPALTEVARAHGATPAQVALAWLLQRSPGVAVIPGTVSLSHLEENVAAAGLRLTVEDVAALDRERLWRYRARRVVRRARVRAGRMRRSLGGRVR
jgi:aryl-alcohol dehydrogenase-like predicted oxidoreductase